MKLRKSCIILCSVFIFCMLALEPAIFAQAVQDTSSGSGGYLSQYGETAVKPVQSSWRSTVAYLVTLFGVFAFVAFLAYFVSKFLGNRFRNIDTGKSSKLLDNLSLGTNRAVCVVEVAGKVMIIGVTEHSISLLDEITDEMEIAKLRSDDEQSFSGEGFHPIFEKQLLSLDKLSRKLPNMLNSKKDRR